MTDSPEAGAPLRVVQWATGNIGSRSLRHVIEHPDMELAGVYVTAGGGKAGRDAADLCGRTDGYPARRQTGIAATADIDEILALNADCVLYMPAACDLDQVCRILESGANIVTTRGEFHHPASLSPGDRKRVEAACERGKTSIHSTGSSPGFVSEALPLVLTSIQRRLDLLTIYEYADLSQRNSPDLLFNLMGFGSTADEFDERRFSYGAVAFGPTLRLTAEALGLPLDDVTSTGEVALAVEETSIAAGTILPRRVVAQRMAVTGSRGGRPLIHFVACWYCSDRFDAPWGVRETGWKVTVDGDAPLDVDIRFPFPLDRMAEMTPGYTANRAVNAVPYVCAAPPGIRTTVDLPQVIARLR